MDLYALGIELGGALDEDGILVFPTDDDADAFFELIEEEGLGRAEPLLTLEEFLAQM